jgi:DNA repair exonuclease SbcCD ATPase subunit
VRIFNGLFPQFRQIFLVTHSEEMKDMMPVVWSVEEVSEGLSTVITQSFGGIKTWLSLAEVYW